VQDKMRIAVIGTGYVGLVSAACFARAGHYVSCVDIDAAKICLLQRGDIPIYEPGLAAILSSRNVRKRLVFTSDAAHAVSTSEVVFIAVGTPSRPSDGHADLSQVFAAVEGFSQAVQPGSIIVTKSTVPVGTGDTIEALLGNLRPDLDFDVASNPEFLRAGSAIGDFVRPDRVVIGAESDRAAAALIGLYRSVGIERARILRTDVRSAELIKYAANGFLATKIAFINEMSDLCERVNARIGDVVRGIGLDRRIGAQYFEPGPGFGGSCFPKDARALAKIGEDHDTPMRVIETVLASNDARKRAMARKVARAYAGHLRGKTVALLGLTFKAETDDMREAVSIPLAHGLADAGCLLRAYDPVANDRARGILPPCVSYHASPLEAAENADAIVIVTEWSEFKRLDFARLRAVMKTPLIVDLRNLLSAEEARSGGFKYISIGEPASRHDLETTRLSTAGREYRARSRSRAERSDTEIRITAAE
jgi:UDPglucose 6-dehydrogenase